MRRVERGEPVASEMALTIAEADDASAEFVRLSHAAVDDAYRLAGYLLGDATEAQDAVQDALVRAWRHWPSLRDPARFGAWLDQIVVNCCRDRHRRRRPLLVGLVDAEEREAADEFRRMFDEDVVAAAVRDLPPDRRVVVALRYWRDLTIPEIAERLRLPEGTVKSRLHYALRTLERALGEDRHE